MADPFARACAAAGIPFPPELQAFHDGTERVWVGRVTVTRGRGWPVRAVLGLAGFPPEGDTEVRMRVAPEGEGMLWERSFGGHVTRSHLRYRGGAVEERFGPFRVSLRPEPLPGGFGLRVTGMRLLGLPLPRPLWPRPNVAETGADGAVLFDIGAHAPLLGLMIRYRGSLRPTS